MELIIREDRCKGCSNCVNACPKKALSFSENINVQGVNYVQVDKEKCIACGTCYTVCPDLVFEIR